MLDTKEMKVVLATLTSRRAWLLKALEDQNLDIALREEHLATLKVLESSMQKLARLASQTVKPPATKAGPFVSTRKPTKRPTIEAGDAYVLIAEDNRDSAVLLKGVLEDLGIKKIDVVEDGRSALYALQNCSPPYDIVLCDWDMPGMSGIDVHRNVKSLAKLRDTHFVMVTAISEAARIREAIQQGVSDYLVKPIDIDVLEKKLMTALAGEPSAEKEQVLLPKGASDSRPTPPEDATSKR